ncbi:HTH_48 domain-containing protein [Trichonephila clavipes]|nr:HTH_48 domain-containing protein [Trichonephila clavipes]
MCAAIENPAKCEVRGGIRFLWAKKLSAVDIHRELCAVYGSNIMSEGVLRQWVRFFKDGRTNIHEESRSGRTSVVSADNIK